MTLTQECFLSSPPIHTNTFKNRTQRTEITEPGAFQNFPVLLFCSVSDGGASEQQNKTKSDSEGPGEDRREKYQSAYKQKT